MSNWDDDDALLHDGGGFPRRPARLRNLGHRTAPRQLRRSISRSGIQLIPARIRGGPHAESGCSLQSRNQIRRSAWNTCSAWAPHWIATGHYAQIRHGRPYPELLKAADAAKDQSYFLHGVRGLRARPRRCFPSATCRRREVREMAHAAGLPVYDKPDSTGICFIGERPFQEFLSRQLAHRTRTDRDCRWASPRRASRSRAVHPGPALRPESGRARRRRRRALVRRGQRSWRATRSSWFRIRTIHCCCRMPSTWSRCIGSNPATQPRSRLDVRGEDALSAERFECCVAACERR